MTVQLLDSDPAYAGWAQRVECYPLCVGAGEPDPEYFCQRGCRANEHGQHGPDL